MQFDSLAAALAMDGHGAYVWAVVVITTLVIGGLLLLPIRSSRRFLDEQRQLIHQGQAAERAPAAPVVTIEEVNNASSS